MNCDGAHLSSSKQCNVWKTEKEIQRMKTEKKKNKNNNNNNKKQLSYPDARKYVRETSSDEKPLCSSVAAKQTVPCSSD